MKNGILEPKDLQIGDWVWYDQNVFEDDPYKVEVPLKIMQIESGEDIDLAIEGCYSPVKLTAKILEKNGWVWRDLPFEQYFEKDGLIIHGTLGNWSIPVMNNVSIDVSHFHQLQHALRDCGEEEQANNLKIK